MNEINNLKFALDEKLSSDMLIVFDFSAVVNIKSQMLLDIVTECIISKNIKVAVSRDFYENYDVIIKSLNDKQKEMAEKVTKLLSLLNQNNKLMYASDIVASDDIVSNLCKNSKVCFVYYCNSEMSESIRRYADVLSCKAVIVNDAGVPKIYDDRNEIVKNSTTEIDRTVLGDEYFAVSFLADEGANVRTRDNELLTLKKLVGRGGEGSVYECDYKNGYVAKIYHKGQLNKLRLKKLNFMEKKQIEYAGICWPEKMIFSLAGEPIGYIMKKIDGISLYSLFDSAESVVEAYPYWTRQNLISLAIGVIENIQYLHLFGILIGDLRLKNIIIDEKNNPVLVDIDSCQVDSLPCPAGFEDYTPPELQGIEFKEILRKYENESFSCMVLIFKLLFCGMHPCDQKNGADTIEEEIRNMTFPYSVDCTENTARIPSGGYDKMWATIPHQMQVLFYNVFAKGKRYTLNEILLMLKTYNTFIDMKKDEMPSVNKILFDDNQEE